MGLYTWIKRKAKMERLKDDIRDLYTLYKNYKEADLKRQAKEAYRLLLLNQMILRTRICSCSRNLALLFLLGLVAILIEDNFKIILRKRKKLSVKSRMILAILLIGFIYSLLC